MDEPCEHCPCKAICLRYPAFCEWMADPEHPHHGSRRRHICARSAMGVVPEYPPLATQAANLAGALGRVAGAVVRGEVVKVPPPVYYERLAICRECEFNGERPAGVRCTKCGCGGMKLQLSTEACPVGKWHKWEASKDDDRGVA